MEKQLNDINAFLDAYPAHIVRAALKARNAHLRGERMQYGWKPWGGSTPPSPPNEWRVINGKMQYREWRPPEPPYPDIDHGGQVVPGDHIRCFCGSEMFPQSVCPNCAKGKAGMKTMWVCGDDSEHVVYTEY